MELLEPLGNDLHVIGVTNRLDAIDPVLRRPGRFDREFYFSLPRTVEVILHAEYSYPVKRILSMI